MSNIPKEYWKDVFFFIEHANYGMLQQEKKPIKSFLGCCPPALKILKHDRMTC